MRINELKGRGTIALSNLPMDPNMDEHKFSSLLSAIRTFEFASIQLGLTMKTKLIEYKGEPKFAFVMEKGTGSSVQHIVTEWLLNDDYLMKTQPDIVTLRKLDHEFDLTAAETTYGAKLSKVWEVLKFNPTYGANSVAVVYTKSLTNFHSIFEDVYKDGLAKGLYEIMMTDYTTARASYLAKSEWALKTVAPDKNYYTELGLGVTTGLLKKPNEDSNSHEANLLKQAKLIDYLCVNERTIFDGVVAPRIAYKFEHNLIDTLVQGMMPYVPGVQTMNCHDVFDELKDYLVYLFANDYTATDMNIPLKAEVAYNKNIQGILTKQMIEGALSEYENVFLAAQTHSIAKLNNEDTIGGDNFWYPACMINSGINKENEDISLFSGDLGGVIPEDASGTIGAFSTDAPAKSVKYHHYVTQKDRLSLTKLEIMACELVWHVYNHYLSAQGCIHKVNFSDDVAATFTSHLADMTAYSFKTSLVRPDDRKLDLAGVVDGDSKKQGIDQGPILQDKLSESLHNQFVIMLRAFSIQYMGSIGELIDRAAMDIDKIIRAKLISAVSNGKFWLGPSYHHVERDGIAEDSFGENVQLFRVIIRGYRFKIYDESALQATYVRVRHTFLPMRKCIISRCEGKELRNGLTIK